jgi:acyl-[acyl-carrier-protein]-phospholipid O-acyltransferase/long-chain-fatty-acid--[acyl-carrier-protein] ligase
MNKTMEKRDQSALVERVIRNCRKRRKASKVVDSTGGNLSGGDLLIRALVLRRLLRRGVLGGDEKHVGVLLPPTAAGVVTNFALTLDRRVVVNLNYSLSSELLNNCIAQAGIKHVITSRLFLRRFDFKLDAELVFLEDFREAATKRDKLTAAFQAHALPAPLLARLCGHSGDQTDEPLTIMFTSGTTGDPKGAVLTYGNIAFSADAVDKVIHIKPEDRLVGILPFFHSFGYTITLWTVLTIDVNGAYHPNPLDAQLVGRFVREQKGTILLSTPMFLRAYLRRCEPEDFASLEVLITGGEHLPKQVADEFEAKFGIRPIEGYGCTETSPLISANIPLSRTTAATGNGLREGTVGRPVPGVRVKTVDPETGAELPAGERGMLLATGRNVMAGYLNKPEATAAAIRDGWYVTGDLAIVDGDGFITLVGRESRFAKIGGEMVSHVAVETALAEIVGASEDGMPRVAVVSVPDKTKGERLVVIHSPLEQSPDELRKGLSAAGLPNLYIPAPNSFVEVEALPFIGTGKLDLRRVRQIANEAFVQEPAAATSAD